MNPLELDLMEYIHNREAVIEQALRDYGHAGAHQAVTERNVLAQVRRVIEGRYSVCGSAAL